MLFSMTFIKPLITYFPGSRCMSTNATVDQSRNKNSKTIILALSNSETCMYVFLIFFRGVTRYSEQTVCLKKCFPNWKSIAHFFFFFSVPQLSFRPPASPKCAEILIISKFQPLLPFRWFWRSSIIEFSTIYIYDKEIISCNHLFVGSLVGKTSSQKSRLKASIELGVLQAKFYFLKFYCLKA